MFWYDCKVGPGAIFCPSSILHEFRFLKSFLNVFNVWQDHQLCLKRKKALKVDKNTIFVEGATVVFHLLNSSAIQILFLLQFECFRLFSAFSLISTTLNDSFDNEKTESVENETRNQPPGTNFTLIFTFDTVNNTNIKLQINYFYLYYVQVYLKQKKN